ncbi:hypothetical protein TNCV_3885521 [Trichonephila clavipes]|nr:hypothetical protein TNCV_3885521 [Trichonephila clavipes]
MPFAAVWMSLRRQLLRLHLTRNHGCVPRKWCDERWMWTLEWDNIVFTDENRFSCNITMVGFEFGYMMVRGC